MGRSKCIEYASSILLFTYKFPLHISADYDEVTSANSLKVQRAKIILPGCL